MRCAMGTICASPYANILMAQFGKQHIYRYSKNKSMLYLQYIDDLFMIWTGNKQELLIFFENSTANMKRSNLNKIFHTVIYHFWTQLYIKTKPTLFKKLSTKNSVISNLVSMYILTISDHTKPLKRRIR